VGGFAGAFYGGFWSQIGGFFWVTAVRFWVGLLTAMSFWVAGVVGCG
jgi:hypothetical protein